MIFAEFALQRYAIFSKYPNFFRNFFRILPNFHPIFASFSVILAVFLFSISRFFAENTHCSHPSKPNIYSPFIPFHRKILLPPFPSPLSLPPAIQQFFRILPKPNSPYPRRGPPPHYKPHNAPGRRLPAYMPATRAHTGTPSRDPCTHRHPAAIRAHTDTQPRSATTQTGSRDQ